MLVTGGVPSLRLQHYRDWETVVIVACSYGPLYSQHYTFHSKLYQKRSRFPSNLSFKKEQHTVLCVYRTPCMGHGTAWCSWPPPAKFDGAVAATAPVHDQKQPTHSHRARYSRSCVVFDTERTDSAGCRDGDRKKNVGGHLDRLRG
jgi:hypothetical protein